MTQWLRLYTDSIFNPKLLRLNDKLFREWITLLCIAAKNHGLLPPAEDIALMLRIKPANVANWIAKLHQAGLLDETEAGFAPHNWKLRQYQSDTSTERVKRFRNGQRNVSETRSATKTETAPETETVSEQNDPEADASGAVAPTDHRKRLFDSGLKTLARMTGKGPDACRSFVGKCLKAAGDDAVIVLGLIEDAERNQTIDPSAWIVAKLKSKQETPYGRRTVHDAANDLVARVRALDEPAPSNLCGGESEVALRLLPTWRCE